jgi:hypothetical protein
VAPTAQRKVPRPEGLDLDAWLGEPIPDETDEAFGRSAGGGAGDDDYFGDLARQDDPFGSAGAGTRTTGGTDDFGFAYADATTGLSKEEMRRMAEQVCCVVLSAIACVLVCLCAIVVRRDLM